MLFYLFRIDTSGSVFYGLDGTKHYRLYYLYGNFRGNFRGYMADAVSVMESQNKQHKRHAEKIAAAKNKTSEQSLGPVWLCSDVFVFPP